MNYENLKTHRCLPLFAGILVFSLSFVLFKNENLEHKRYFKDQLTVNSKIASNQIMDKLNFYSDVVYHKSINWGDMENLTENEWLADSAFHIRHCVGIQSLIWMDPLFNPVWVAPRRSQEDFLGMNFAGMAKTSETEGGAWVLSEDGKNIRIFIPAFKDKNLTGYTLGAIDIHKTLEHLFANEKDSNIRLALYVGDKRVYSNGDIVEKDEEHWSQEKTMSFHGIHFRLKIWPLSKLIDEAFDSYLAYIVLLFGSLLAVFTALLIRLLQKKSFYLQEINKANINLAKENTEKDRVNEQLRKLSRSAEQSPSSIIITDTAGRIEFVNPKFTRLSGYAPDEVIGRNPRFLKSGKTSASEYENLWKSITSGGDWHGEFRNRKKNGDCFWGSASISPIRDALGKITHYISSMEDITERKLAEEKIKASLLEKEVLMREINHRAKNNLQVVSSLIKMQSREAEDPRFARLSQDLGNRIAAMTLVHDQILQSNDLNQIDTGRYIISLARNILASYGENRGRIVLNADTGDIFLDVDTCIHCGLIINELLSNSMKYAFAPEQRGVIGITLRHGLEDGCLELIVHDNGAGMNEGIDILKAKSLGMRLVTALVEDQLRGRIELNRNRGTEFKIIFPAVK